ncbi:MAG TPA: GNAT family N-acetyltransferase [Gaiellaceae bacterium]|jgi:ribosomal protein S18 acetylase RimI-like enzyme|nr:GNAT family N-acetyltransferase [Gaiellaceae bacterium]
MRDELAHAYAFLARGDMGGSRTVDSPYGRAVYTDEVPKRSDCNYLWVEREAGPKELVAEAERLERRLIFVPDNELGAKLAPWFAEHGWRIDRHLVMAQLRDPDRSADLSLVRELDEEALRPARRRLLEDQPWAKPDVVDQLFRAKALIGERVTARFFGIQIGGEVVSYTDLYTDGADAQIEDVGTLPEHRGSGYATAVILAGIAHAREGGADFVFLVADAEDWPKELYRRLGFDELGHYTKFFAPRT